MPSRSTAPGSGSRLDRVAVAGLGLAGFVLSLDALRQMAAAAHIRPGLTWLFPLILDGFTAYSIRALIVLRNAPLAARAYVWLLLVTATGVSVWANVLHAVVLTRSPFSPAPGTHSNTSPGLELGSGTVGVLAACAPLALAAAAHLHTLIARHTKDIPPPAAALPESPAPARTARPDTRDHVSAGTESAQPDRNPHHEPGGAEPEAADPYSAAAIPHRPSPPDPHTAGHSPAGMPARPETEPGPAAGVDQSTESSGTEPPAAPRRGRRPGADLDQLIAIGRAATLDQGTPVTRDNVEAAIRAQGLPVGAARLAKVVGHLKNPIDDTTDLDSDAEQDTGIAPPPAARPAA